ncbi:hypothetical protein L6R21_01535 [bacterium]|nr:hypothetical protein [bacterium]
MFWHLKIGHAMKKLLAQLADFFGHKHRATLVVLLIVLMAFMPFYLRKARLQTDFARAARNVEMAEFYRNRKEKQKALSAIEDAIRLYSPVLARQDSALVKANRLRTEIAQLP